jgi:hypothetical protein
MAFGYQDIGLVLDSRECVVLNPRGRGEFEEQRTPALAQVRGAEIRAIGQRAFRLVGKSSDVVCVFPGRVEDPLVLARFLERILPPRSLFRRRRLWTTVPTAASLQLQHNLRNCLDQGLGARDMQLVPEILAAAVGCGFAVLGSEEDSHRARMVVHLSGTRMAAGVFLDGSLVGLSVREGSWDRVVREVQENLQFRLGATLGYGTFFKVVRLLSRSFFDRQQNDSGREKASAASEVRPLASSEPGLAELEPAGDLQIEPVAPPNLRSFSERGLIEYVVEDENISRAIDAQLRNVLFSLEKVIFGCFSQLRAHGRGEIASDLFSDRIVLCGDIFFEAAAVARYFSRLTRFRFEASNGHAVAKGLRRILNGPPPQKHAYQMLSDSIHDTERLASSRV